MSKRMYHPCHKLSVPSAKIFWCRHCMQMFEDAISRWKHSKICRGIPGIKQKDQDGQVIQMYVKPDKVSYTSNVVPGQTIYHKPQVKKASADLKCVICQAKFSSLHDMREHVKYPCQRTFNSVPSESEDSDSEESPSSLKIRRVELLESTINTSTALAVLAEASKHVESLSHQSEQVVETSGQTEVQYVGQDWSRKTPVCVTPTYEQFQSAKPVKIRPIVRTDLEPVVIVIQAEDGQDIPESSLDINTIQNCVKESIHGLPVGQIVQVEINVQDKKIKQFCVGAHERLHPLEEVYPGAARPEKAVACSSELVISSVDSLATPAALVSETQQVLTEIVHDGLIPELSTAQVQEVREVAQQTNILQEINPQFNVVQELTKQTHTGQEITSQAHVVQEITPQADVQEVKAINHYGSLLNSQHPHVRVTEQETSDGVFTEGEVVIEEVCTVTESNIFEAGGVNVLASSAAEIAPSTFSQSQAVNSVPQCEASNQIVIQPLPVQPLTSTLQRLLQTGGTLPYILRPVQKPINHSRDLSLLIPRETLYSFNGGTTSPQSLLQNIDKSTRQAAADQPRVQIIEARPPTAVSVRSSSELLNHLTSDPALWPVENS